MDKEERKEYMKNWNIKNRDKARASHRKYYSTSEEVREKIKERRKKWIAEHPEKRKEYRKNDRVKNLEKRREYDRNYQRKYRVKKTNIA